MCFFFKHTYLLKDQVNDAFQSFCSVHIEVNDLLCERLKLLRRQLVQNTPYFTVQLLEENKIITINYLQNMH